MSDPGGHSQATGHSEAERNMIGDRDAEVENLKATIEDKDRQIRNLELVDRGKESMLKQLSTQFSSFLDRLSSANRKVGELENENRRLRELPSRGRGSDSEVVRESNSILSGDK